MNKITVLFFVFIVALISCDGRDRAHKNNQDALKENKLLDSFSESIKYFPESYAEIITDTILRNGFTVNIKLHTDMNNTVLKSFKKNHIEYKHYYRDFIANITVSKDDIEIFNESIKKSFLIKNSHTSRLNLSKSTLNDVWVDQMYSMASNNKIKIDVSYSCINNNLNSLYIIYIDASGKYTIQEPVSHNYS